jgi:predicted thioesterase
MGRQEMEEQMDGIYPGLVGEQEAKVGEAQLATKMGSGSVDAYATPAMIALIEQAAVAAIDPLLPEGQASVGTALEVRHLAATPLGARVRARAEVIAVEGRQITLRVEAWDEHEQIGAGVHTRYVIDVSRFMERARAKA